MLHRNTDGGLKYAKTKINNKKKGYLQGTLQIFDKCILTIWIKTLASVKTFASVQADLFTHTSNYCRLGAYSLAQAKAESNVGGSDASEGSFVRLLMRDWVHIIRC